MIIIQYGDAGALILPQQRFTVPLYDGKASKNAQIIVDRENSATIKRRFRGGHCDYIADHAAQGFDIIKDCKLNAIAVVQTPTSSRIYQCNAIMYGRNTGKNLITCTGQALTNVKWADMCLYTCNDTKGVSITMVFFKLLEESKNTIYKVGDEG